ncbi:class I SAM-dependent methyltransferase [Leptospira stimsonii]|uniref:Class I SAM-dependent methyltransferase n=1 Tax=Leptospira stimsonii TaxID=2202203 RepID=A0ABY2N280_9LEPT|nr:class I SAM-dependent methyltransferase [Leptospira stimsonii]TGK20673.1 class I SAM-dependent methyltransferase [Leptospira stimsonii]TGM14463.1 class I SAM-dependent methyltransferase [Leptospira stimsonii]
MAVSFSEYKEKLKFGVRGKKEESSEDEGLTRGANGLPFETEYWRDIYGSGTDVDATFNAKEHARYAKSILNLMEINVNSIADFGFGKGILLKEMVKIFKPGRVLAIDPSEQMLDELIAQKWIRAWNISVLNTTVQELDLSYFVHLPFDLGICNSVVQYIEGDLKPVFEKLHKIVKYLYFSVPTKDDYIRMKKEIYFEDPYAFVRTKKEYMKMIEPYFRRVGFNLLESRLVADSRFTDQLFKDE